MKLLHVIASVDPAGGGPVEGMKLISSSPPMGSHTTEVVTLDSPASRFVSEFPFKVHACGPGWGRYGYTSKLSNWIAKHGPQFDAAVFHGLWNHSAIGGWQGSRRANLPYVLYSHGMMDPWFRNAYPFKHWMKQVFWLAVQGRVLRDANEVLFTCEEERQLARGGFFGYNYRERVVSYGIAVPPPITPLQESWFRKTVPELAGRRFFLFLSRIHEKKGCDLLLTAFAELASSFPEIDLVIAGPDQHGLTARLKMQARQAGIEKRVHWPGMLTGEAKWGAFRAAEAFILPSHQENFGIVVAEAMACGTPVLITNKVNIWREVAKSGAGYVQDDTKDGVTRLLTDWLQLKEDDRSFCRVQALRGFERFFRVEKAATDLLAAVEVMKRDRKV